MQSMVNALTAMSGLKIMVVGDLMLDTFVHGSVERISPEAAVPVLAITREESMLGGAGNVLANLSALNVIPVVFTVTGKDAGAEKIIAAMNALDVDANGLVQDESRPTILKTRFVARGQQLLRTDVEKTHGLSAQIETILWERIQKALVDVKAVVLSDYGKGVLTKTLVDKIMAAAKEKMIPVLVDPKGHDYTIYRGADFVTPNRKELSEASGVQNLKTDAQIIDAATKVMTECGIGCVIATRSEDGLSVVPKTGAPIHFKAQVRDVFDVSGAGDTVIATLAAALASGASVADGAAMANIAGGIAVSKSGTAPVRSDELLAAILGQGFKGKQARLAPIDDAALQAAEWKAQGLTVGLTGGCFDILHAGHVNYLNEARSRCDRLIVALNRDASVRILKGPERPVNDEQARSIVIGGLGCVDLVVLFGAEKAGEDNTPCAVIEAIRPDIFFKGGDYTVDQLPEAKIVAAYGGEVSIMKMHQGFSTTNIIEKTRRTA